MPASSEAILWPLVAQAALVAAVWVCLYRERFTEMRRRRIDPQSLRTSRDAGNVLQQHAAADNFRNLFEVPVLFFAMCLALAITGYADAVQVTLAWMFVALRAVHSAIHVSYNRVTHRFAAYALSTLCVFAMWILFAIALWRGRSLIS